MKTNLLAHFTRVLTIFSLVLLPMSSFSQSAILDNMQALDNSFRLGAGDTITFRIVEERGNSQSMTINDSGVVDMPYIGQVQAAGLTCLQLAMNCKAALEREHFREATVIVTVGKVRALPQSVPEPSIWGPEIPQEANFVTVYGQVGQQGKLLMPQDAPMSISEAILQSGGFAQFAEKKKVKILRRIGRGANDLLTIYVNVDAIMRKGRLDYDIPMRPNDVIIVGEKILNF